MPFLESMSRWKLFGSWLAYWALLIVVGLGPAIPPIWRATHAGPDQGSIQLSFGNGGFLLKVFDAGATIYSGSIHFLPFALLVAGPPLALWLTWRRSRSHRSSSDAPVGR